MPVQPLRAKQSKSENIKQEMLAHKKEKRFLVRHFLNQFNIQQQMKKLKFWSGYMLELLGLIALAIVIILAIIESFKTV